MRVRRLMAESSLEIPPTSRYATASPQEGGGKDGVSRTSDPVTQLIGVVTEVGVCRGLLIMAFSRLDAETFSLLVSADYQPRLPLVGRLARRAWWGFGQRQRHASWRSP